LVSKIILTGARNSPIFGGSTMKNKYKFPLYNKLMFNFMCWIYKGNTEKQISMIFKYGDPYGLFDKEDK